MNFHIYTTFFLFIDLFAGKLHPLLCEELLHCLTSGHRRGWSRGLLDPHHGQVHRPPGHSHHAAARLRAVLPETPLCTQCRDYERHRSSSEVRDASSGQGQIILLLFK